MVRGWSGWSSGNFRSTNSGSPATTHLRSSREVLKNFGTSACTTSLLISSLNRRRTSEEGAWPGRKPGSRAARAYCPVTFCASRCTTSAGTSMTSSLLQVCASTAPQWWVDGLKYGGMAVLVEIVHNQPENQPARFLCGPKKLSIARYWHLSTTKVADD